MIAGSVVNEKRQLLVWAFGIFWLGGWGYAFFRYADRVTAFKQRMSGGLKELVPGKKFLRWLGVVAMVVAGFALFELLATLWMLLRG